jgi:hypothetical protein
MFKKAILILAILILNGCAFDSNEYLSTENYARYQAYYTSIFDNDRFLTYSDAFLLEVVFTKIENQYRYDIIIDQPNIAMYDIEVMVVENDISFERSDKMMPNFGIFETNDTNMIPYQVDVSKGYVKGIILSGLIDVPVVELKIMIAWKDYAKLNSTREFFLRNLDYDRMQDGSHDNDDEEIIDDEEDQDEE